MQIVVVLDGNWDQSVILRVPRIVQSIRVIMVTCCRRHVVVMSLLGIGKPAWEGFLAEVASIVVWAFRDKSDRFVEFIVASTRHG